MYSILQVHIPLQPLGGIGIRAAPVYPGVQTGALHADIRDSYLLIGGSVTPGIVKVCAVSTRQVGILSRNLRPTYVLDARYSITHRAQRTTSRTMSSLKEAGYMILTPKIQPSAALLLHQRSVLAELHVQRTNV